MLLIDPQIAACDVCQRSSGKPLSYQTELHPVPIHSPWYHVGFDFIGPITPASSSGNRYILTLLDYYIKWVEAVPLPSKCATGVAASLMKVKFLFYLQPVIIVCALHTHTCIHHFHGTKVCSQGCHLEGLVGPALQT